MSDLLKKSPIRFAKRMLVEYHDKIRWLIPDRYSAYSVAGGKIYLNVRESSMMLERSFGLYEPEKMQAVRAFLKRGGSFVDVGGNKGDFSLLAAKLAGENGNVVCVEPEPTNLGWIRRSVELNGYKNIQLCNLALSDHDGECTLYLGTKSGFHTLLSGQPDRDKGSLTVKTRTLDNLLRELKVRAVNILKIDVEGAELQVLKGATETIRANPDMVILIDIHPFLGVDPAAVFQCLHSRGFTACQMRPPYNVPTTPHEGIYDIVARRL